MLAKSISKLLILGALSVLLALAGCGGSSGSSDDGGGVFPALGALSGATVYVTDTSGDNTGLTLPIAIGITDASGALTTLSNLGQFSSSHYPLTLSVQDGTTPSGGTFSGELKGTLDSSTSEAYITPASTMVVGLIESGKTPAEAKALVRSFVQNTMGMGSDIDPLGDFTASTQAKQQIEMAQYALMALLGLDASVESDETAQDALSTNIATLVANIASGDSFGTAVNKVNPSVPAAGVATFVKDNINTIKSNAETALQETVADTNVPTVDDTTDFPESFKVVPGGSATTIDQTVLDPDTTSTFTVATGSTNYLSISVTTADGTWDTATDATFEFTTVPGSGTFSRVGGSVVAVDTDIQAESDAAAPNFSFVAPATATTVTFTIQSTGPGTAISRTLTIKVVDPSTTVSASDLEWVGTVTNNILGFTDVDSSAGTSLTDGDIVSLGSQEFEADVEIVGGASYSSNVDAVTAQYRVSFQAPDGFKFLVSGDTTPYSNYDLATLSYNSGDTFTAEIPAGVKIQATKDVPFGVYSFVAKLINKSTNSVERSTSESMYTIDNTYANLPAKIVNVQFTNSDGTTTNGVVPSASGVVTFDDTTNEFTGKVLTWTDIATEATNGPAAVSGDWYVLASPAPATGTYGFTSTAVTTATANYDVGTTSASTYDASAGYSAPTITIDVTNLVFNANTAVNADSITLQYIDDSNGINIKSTGGFTLKTD